MKNQDFSNVKFVLLPEFAGCGRLEKCEEKASSHGKFVLTPKFAGIGSMEG